jgi:hypothetical protein
VPVPPEQDPKPEPTQAKVQEENVGTTCEVAGAVPVQLLASTVVPSERTQLLVRVSVAVAEQVELGAPQALDSQEKEQVLKSLKDCASAPSVPHENPEVGVHEALVAGSVPAPEHKLASTVWPSDCKQAMVRVWVEDRESAVQVPVRVCVKLAPQPVVGAQEA